MTGASEAATTCDVIVGLLALEQPLSEELAAHLVGCSSCRQTCDVSRLMRNVLHSAPNWVAGERVLDQYEVLEELGRGGQGAVFKARDQETTYVVALKVVQLDKQSVDEVLHAIGITHPNVCRINYTKTCGPYRVIVMEYVRGGTLKERLAKGPLPHGQAMAVFRCICDGVRAAHDHNVLHLDLKPANVLLRDGVLPVVSDFGLATVSGGAARGGTDRYMAPEQKRGERPDQRADIFALGVILSDLVPHPPPGVRAMIQRATMKSSDERFANVSELLDALDRSERGALRWALPAATLVVALMGAAVGLRYLAPPRQAGVAPSGIGASVERVAAPPAPSEAVSAVAVDPPRPTGPTSETPPSTRETNPARSALTPSAGRVALVKVPQAQSPTPALALQGGKQAGPAVATRTPETCSPSLLADCKKQCALDDAASCYNAGRHILNNFNDAHTASAFFKLACDRTFLAGCVDLGMMHENGNGVSKDLAEAARLYQRACDLGGALGCSNLGGLYGNGNGVPQDLQRATKLFARACEAGDSSGCGNLGLAYNDGSGVAMDKVRAIDLFKRACRADTAWCRDYKEAKAEERTRSTRDGAPAGTGATDGGPP